MCATTIVVNTVCRSPGRYHGIYILHKKLRILNILNFCVVYICYMCTYIIAKQRINIRKKLRILSIHNFFVQFIYCTACINYTKKLRIFNIFKLFVQRMPPPPPPIPQVCRKELKLIHLHGQYSIFLRHSSYHFEVQRAPASFRPRNLSQGHCFVLQTSTVCLYGML